MKYFFTSFLLFFSLLIYAQYASVIDSIEQEVRNSSGIERCKQVIKLFRAFENQIPEGIYEFPGTYHQYVHECILIAESKNELNLLNSLKISKAALELREGQQLEVIKLVNEVLASGLPLSLADSLDAYVFLSGTYYDLGFYEKALDMTPTKLNVAKQLKRSDVIIETTADVAFTYYKLKVYELAAINYRKLVNIYIADNNFYMAASHSNNLGLVYSHWGKFDSALIIYNKAKEYAFKNYGIHKNDIKQEFFLGLIDGNIGEVYLELGKYDKAIKLLERDVAASKHFGNFLNVSNSLKTIGKAYQLKGNPAVALMYVDSASHILASKGILTLKSQIEIEELKAHVLIDLKDFEQSSLIHHNLIDLKDSLQSIENSKRALISNSVFQVYQKENELIGERANLVEAEIRHFKDIQYRSILYAITIVLLLSVIHIAIILKKKNKLNKLLQSRSQEIEDQKIQIGNNLAEKEALLKEIQHRVKNNLQVISGIIQLQLSNFKDPDIQRVMEECQSRIKAMAIIHQQLYKQGDDLRYISFNAYLKDLTTQIASSFKQKSRKIAIEIDAKNIHFNVNTAIPLGIIINELVSNSFKYAFEDRSEGIISISIIKEKEHQYLLTVKDNGVGLAAGFDLAKVSSLGLKLVIILSKQLEGDFDFVSTDGTIFCISFKDNVAV